MPLNLTQINYRYQYVTLASMIEVRSRLIQEKAITHSYAKYKGNH